MKRLILIICIIFSCIVGYSQQKTHNDMSVSIEFIVNTNTIIHNSGYNYYINTIIPYLRKNINDLDRILLVGSASPEGNKEGNIRLANIRADKIYSYIKNFVPRNKIEINNDYDLFLSKTGLDESDWSKLRATYVEIVWKDKPIEVKPKVDTVYKEKSTETHNIIYKDRVDTVYKEIEKPIIVEKIIREKDTVYLNKKNEDKLVFSIYNSLSEDLLIRPNIGLEFYFHQMSWFIDGSFSSGSFYGKKYDIDFCHTGFRKYFNDNYNKVYIELYGRTGWYDTDILSKDNNGVFGIFFGTGLGIGYKFSVCKHWKITPNIRFGFDNFKFNDYYYSGSNGNIDVTFGAYTDGRKPSNEVNPTQSTNKNGNTVYLNDKTINRDFYNKASNLYWFGPTYIGVTIQRDFYIHK